MFTTNLVCAPWWLVFETIWKLFFIYSLLPDGELPLATSFDNLVRLHNKHFEGMSEFGKDSFRTCRVSPDQIAFHLAQFYDNETLLWKDPYTRAPLEKMEGDSIVNYKARLKIQS